MPYKIDKSSSLMLGCDYIPSPNCNERPQADDISLVVIHGISLPPGQFGGPYVEQLFTNRLDVNKHEYFKGLEGLKVSSHLFIRRDGEAIQFVPLQKRAWHAGVSHFQGRDNCNDFSIGIELEGTDDQAYDERQYASLVELLLAIFKAFPQTGPQRVVGHSDIAPGRKTDPGSVFDWAKLTHVLASRLG